MSKEEETQVRHWPTILDIVSAGLKGDPEECRGYAQLWLEKLVADGDLYLAERLQRRLEGKQGQMIRAMGKEGPNHAQDILAAIVANGPVTAEMISILAGYNRHVVDLALPLMIEHGLVAQAGTTADEWKDPLYVATDLAKQGTWVIPG